MAIVQGTLAKLKTTNTPYFPWELVPQWRFCKLRVSETVGDSFTIRQNPCPICRDLAMPIMAKGNLCS